MGEIYTAHCNDYYYGVGPQLSAYIYYHHHSLQISAASVLNIIANLLFNEVPIIGRIKCIGIKANGLPKIDVAMVTIIM